MSDTIRARPVWVAQGATREDDKCSHRVQVHGSAIRFARCIRAREAEYNGWPLCRHHNRQVEQ